MPDFRRRLQRRRFPEWFLWANIAGGFVVLVILAAWIGLSQPPKTEPLASPLPGSVFGSNDSLRLDEPILVETPQPDTRPDFPVDSHKLVGKISTLGRCEINTVSERPRFVRLIMFDDFLVRIEGAPRPNSIMIASRPTTDRQQQLLYGVLRLTVCRQLGGTEADINAFNEIQAEFDQSLKERTKAFPCGNWIVAAAVTDRLVVYQIVPK